MTNLAHQTAEALADLLVACDATAEVRREIGAGWDAAGIDQARERSRPVLERYRDTCDLEGA